MYLIMLCLTLICTSNANTADEAMEKFDQCGLAHRDHWTSYGRIIRTTILTRWQIN